MFGSRSSRNRNDRSTRRLAGRGRRGRGGSRSAARDRDHVAGRGAALDVDRDVADPGLAVRQSVGSGRRSPSPAASERWHEGHQYVVRGTSPGECRRPNERAASPARAPGAAVHPHPGAAGACRALSTRSRRAGRDQPVERLVVERSRPARAGRPAPRTASRSARCCRSRRAPAGRAAPRRSAVAARAGSRSRRSASAASASACASSRSGPSADSDGWSGLGPLLEQLDDRRVEADRDRARDLEHEPRPRRRPPPALAGPVAVPRAVHPQVGPELEAVVEADEEVLAVRLDRVDRRADDPLDLRAGPGAPGRPSPRGRRDTAAARPRSGTSVSPSGSRRVPPVSGRRGGRARGSPAHEPGCERADRGTATPPTGLAVDLRDDELADPADRRRARASAAAAASATPGRPTPAASGACSPPRSR